MSDLSSSAPTSRRDTVQRSSPQTDRLRRTLNLLASDPREAFTLAHIARHLGVSKATCLPMLSALTSAGWLVRHSVNKTYRLGPALVTLGRAAERSASLHELAAPKMIDLAARTGLCCISWVPSTDRLVLAEVVNARGSQPDWHGLKRGHRLTPAPPLGSSLVAWTRDPAAVDVWLRRAGPTNLEAARAHYAAALSATRTRGYVVELHHRLEHQIFLLTQRLAAEHPESCDDLFRRVTDGVNKELGGREVLVDEIVANRTYLPVSINAPVFGVTGEIEIIICLTDAPEPISGTELHQLGALLRDTCVELSRSINAESPLMASAPAVGSPAVRCTDLDHAELVSLAERVPMSGPVVMRPGGG